MFKLKSIITWPFFTIFSNINNSGLLVVLRINLIKSFNNIDLVFTSIFEDEILFLIKEPSDTWVFMLSNAKGLFEKYTVVPIVFA